MQACIIPIAAAVAIALIAALLLSLAAKFMAVPVNETQVAIRAELPGANCGACGFAGCDDYAAALAEGGDVKTNLCVPGADAVAAAIAAILGQDAEDVIEQVANVRCSGLCDVTKPEMDYQGLKTCAAAKGLFGGPGSCKYGCIGFGDCERVCPYGAIQVCNGLAKVDREKCVGCVRCVQLRRQGSRHQQALLRGLHRLQALREGMQVRRRPRGEQPRRDRHRQVQELRPLRKEVPKEGHPRLSQAYRQTRRESRIN